MDRNLCEYVANLIGKKLSDLKIKHLCKELNEKTVPRAILDNTHVGTSNDGRNSGIRLLASAKPQFEPDQKHLVNVRGQIEVQKRF
ncbi:hypothetical protein MFLAVUS_009423 [Mucor flavus]|uniref:Uncharacterized protein n=1 Tax=Mucor flavus TaxID=439312 RepID=A0ABP9ZA20_9FUNG